MIETKIKILKDTPFNLEGDILGIKEFRLKYDYICTKETSDSDLIHYIKDYSSYPQLKQTSKYNISEWFQVIESIDLEPLVFIHEGIIYSKQIDGYWHKFLVGSEISPQNSIGKESNVRPLIENAKYRKEIMYCTNKVTKKL